MKPEEIITIDDAKKYALIKALVATSCNRSQAAELLGCSIRTLRTMARRFNLFIPKSKYNPKRYDNTYIYQLNSVPSSSGECQNNDFFKKQGHAIIKPMEYLQVLLSLAKGESKINEKLRLINEHTLWLAKNDPANLVVIIDYLSSNYQTVAQNNGLNDNQILKIFDMLKNAKITHAQRY